MNRRTFPLCFARERVRTVARLVLLAGTIGTTVAACSGPGSDTAASYAVREIPTPPGLTAETGGIDFTPGGRLVAVFHRGEVMTYDPETASWSVFAHGLHDPLGVEARSDSVFLVMQRPELTRLVDTDGDGRADVYGTVTDEFGLSGNYHEFAYGPLVDSTGRMYVGLNAASSNAGIFDVVRGPLNELALEGEGYRMFSAVPYRGWIMKYFPEQDTLTPFATGFRSPNGMEIDAEGRLVVTENQGDWVGSNGLHVVRKGRFHGHPAGLLWKEGFVDIRGGDLPRPVLDAMRTKAAVLFPHGILSNSATQPLLVEEDREFGPFTGQLLVGEMNFPRILRVWTEEVHGTVQGGVTTLIDTAGTDVSRDTLRIGNNRLTWGPDGGLWIGQTEHGWPGRPGIQRVEYTGRVPFAVRTMHITPSGFRLRTTRPIDRSTARADSAFSVRSFRYRYSKSYGSPRLDESSVPIVRRTVSPDGRTVDLELEDLREDYVYQVTLGSLRSEDGRPISHRRIFYTVRRLRR